MRGSLLHLARADFGLPTSRSGTTTRIQLNTPPRRRAVLAAVAEMTTGAAMFVQTWLARSSQVSALGQATQIAAVVWWTLIRKSAANADKSFWQCCTMGRCRKDRMLATGAIQEDQHLAMAAMVLPSSSCLQPCLANSPGSLSPGRGCPWVPLLPKAHVVWESVQRRAVARFLNGAISE
ncbi:unnamed protein product [Symbiodinium natans]|uniref:Uncharacterized protein n=1 Tax=Symbiodinium natans TaxID=878477 RepID=A0A812LPL4_9DINO|nr:unnamed protein product [Symbiodinium natans]